MLNLKIIQAEYGDCFILEFGSSSEPHYILIDGGPDTIYEKHLQNELQTIRDNGGKLDLLILSHVDNDHIIGLLDLMAELREQHTNNINETISIDLLWYNSFKQTIGSETNIESRLKTLFNNITTTVPIIETMNMIVKGFGEGNKLKLAATYLDIPINQIFVNSLVSVDNSPDSIKFGNLNFYIVGPTKKNLEELKKEWHNWLEKYENSNISGDPSLAAMADHSIPNLSSIMFLTEMEGKKILFTGDGRGDHLLKGLSQMNLLNSEGIVYVDVLKVPHHGSNRNVTRKFFKTVIADKYIISANGKYGNPDLATLIWIIEAAKENERAIEIIVSNETPSTKKLIQEYNPKEYGYNLKIMQEDSHSLTLEILP